MPATTITTTSWHIIETRGVAPDRHNHIYSTAPSAARVLSSVAAPYRETHRIVRIRRQRMRADLSHVRLTLAPRAAGGSTVMLSAMLVRRSPCTS